MNGQSQEHQTKHSKITTSSIHLLSGGIGGTVGAVVTCPLEVVKTRLQSSDSQFSSLKSKAGSSCSTSSKPHQTWSLNVKPGQLAHTVSMCPNTPRSTIYGCLREIVRLEGARGLFRGIGPTLTGVIPSRALYFTFYHNNQLLLAPYLPSHGHSLYLTSSIISGFLTSTITNPIWFVKTRLQLDRQSGAESLTVTQCVRRTFAAEGALGFYRGVQASYLGLAETALFMVMYERTKRRLLMWRHPQAFADIDAAVDATAAASASATAAAPDVVDGDNGTHLVISQTSDWLFCAAASCVCKSIATMICYPHEVLRTRMREEGARYSGVVQTCRLIWREEGWRSFYRGMATHFVRIIPNACIVMGTYESMLFLLYNRAPR